MATCSQTDRHTPPCDNLHLYKRLIPVALSRCGFCDYICYSWAIRAAAWQRLRQQQRQQRQQPPSSSGNNVYAGRDKYVPRASTSYTPDTLQAQPPHNHNHSPSLVLRALHSCHGLLLFLLLILLLLLLLPLP